MQETAHFGQMLRAKREEMSLSLKEIENATSIRSSYLEAIENGKIGEHISSVYAIGFIRQYAGFLGFDADKLIRENPTAFRLPKQKHDFSYGIGTLEVRGNLGGGVKWIPNLLWGSLGIMALIGAYYFARYLGLF